jgi:hypothetical protein
MADDGACKSARRLDQTNGQQTMSGSFIRALARRQSHLRVAAVAILLFRGIVATGCALHFVDNGGNLPATAKTIYVANFENMTRVQGINDQFMRYVIDTISSRGRLTVVNDPAAADLLLGGQIQYAASAPTTFNAVDEPLQYANALTIGATLTDRRSNKVLWHSNGITGSAVAPVVAQGLVPTTPQFLRQNLRGPDLLRMTDIQVAETQNLAANDQMMQQAASELYADMMWGF